MMIDIQTGHASVGMTGLSFQIIPLSFKTACNSLGTFIKYYKISQLIHTQSIAN